MDAAEDGIFYGAGDAEKRGGKTGRSRAFGAFGVAKAFTFLYPLSLVGRLVKRKVSRAAHRVADRAADRVAERAARILRDEAAVVEAAAAKRAEAAARAPPLEEAEDPKNDPAGTGSESAAEDAAEDAEDDAADDTADDAADDAADAATADVALQCEMEEGAKTRKRILTERAGRGLSLESDLSFEKFKAEYGANLSAPKYHSAPTEGWAFVSEDGE